MAIKRVTSEISKNISWRYLDSLDSIRFSKTDKAPRKLRIKQAEIESAVSLLLGYGITVPNNQLIDSLGFLNIASSIINAAEASEENVFPPLRFAAWGYPSENDGKHLRDPFLLAAHIFDKDGKVNPKYFELSAWDTLGNRRRLWAQEFRKDNFFKLPEDLIGSDAEWKLADSLVSILHFFRHNPTLIVDAGGTGDLQKEMTSAISNLTILEIEKDNYFVKLVDKLGYQQQETCLSMILDTIMVFKKLGPKEIWKDRSNMRRILAEEQDFYFDGVSNTVSDVREGVLKTFNSIYNFAGYQGSQASQEHQTETNDVESEWGSNEIAFSLGQWAREFYVNSKMTKSNEGLTSGLDTFLKSEVQVRKKPKEEQYIKNDFWEIFFEYQNQPKYEAALMRYQKSIGKLKEANKEYKSLDRSEKTGNKKIGFEKSIDSYRKSRETLIRVIDSEFLQQFDMVSLDIVESNEVFLVFSDAGYGETSRIKLEDYSNGIELSKEERNAIQAASKSPSIGAKGQYTDYE